MARKSRKGDKDKTSPPPSPNGVPVSTRYSIFVGIIAGVITLLLLYSEPRASARWTLLGCAGATFSMLTARRELPDEIAGKARHADSGKIDYASLCLVGEILARVTMGALAATILESIIGVQEHPDQRQTMAVVAGLSERFLGQFIDRIKSVEHPNRN